MKKIFTNEIFWFILAALTAIGITRILSDQNYSVLNSHFNYIHYTVDTVYVMMPVFIFLLFIIYGIRTTRSKFSNPFANLTMLVSGVLSVAAMTFLTRTFFHAGFLEQTIYPPLSQLGANRLSGLKPNPFFDLVSKCISVIQLLLIAALLFLTFKWGKTKTTPNVSKLVAFILLSLLALPSMAQKNMKPVEELINTSEPGWPLVQRWIKKAKNKVEVLPRDSVKATEALFQTQVTTRSPMGAIVYSSGGILVDDGWIRILGSGNQRLDRSLPAWNKGLTFFEYGDRPPFLLIADDVVGGFFALNGGYLGNDMGNVYYLSPDNLEWEPLKMTYSEFLHFCFEGRLDKFYKSMRWKDWKNEISGVDGNQVFNFYPFLWTKEGKDISKCSRRAIPVREQFSFNMAMQKQLDRN